VTLHYVRCALGLLLAAGSLAAKSPAVLTAVVIPDGSYSPVALREMEREAGGILKKSGLKLLWRLNAAAEASEGLLVVITLHGSCAMDAKASEFRRGRLGWSHVVNGAFLPFSELACENIRGAVQPTLHDESAPRRNVLLGRAMGRVVAHELYHIVADTSKHGSEGVAQASFSPRELTTGLFELERADADAVRDGAERVR
jgi:hypothetical protein